MVSDVARWRLVVSVSWCLLGVIALGCSGRGRGPEPGTVRILVEAGVQELDPRFALSAYSVKVCHLIHAALVSVDNQASEPRLELAESYEQPDPVTYRFTLRPGLTFHDGHPLTARDVAWTYRSIVDPALGSPYAGMFEKISEIRVLDDRTVEFVLRHRHAPFITDLVMGIVPEHLTRATGRFQGPVVGAGPFELVSWESDRRVVLRRFPGYALPGRGNVRKVVIKTIQDDNSRLLALIGGSGDLVQNGVNPMLLDTLARYPDLRILTGPSVAYNYMGFNLTDPILSRREVRQAIAYGIDREAIVRSRFKGHARLATGLLAPGHWAYEPNVQTYPHDPAKAKALLDRAGYPDPPGPAPRFTLTLKTTTNRFRRSIARLMAHQLATIGIEVKVRSFEWGTFFADVKSGNFQLYTLQWPAVVEPDLYHWIFHSSMIPTPENRGRGGNRNRYVSREVDRLIDLGRATVDRDERRRIYGRIQQIVALDLPYVSLWHEDNIAVTRAGITGYEILPNARFGGLLDTVVLDDPSP